MLDFKKLFFSLKNNIFLTFIPWIFFILFSKQSIFLSSLGALALMVVLNFRQLAKGFVLPWGSTLLFVFLALDAKFGFVELKAIETLRLINSTLAAIVIFSLIIGKPFTLQYAREEKDPRYWHDPKFLKINWILTGIWAFLLIIMALPSYFLSFEQIQRAWFLYYGWMVMCIVTGLQCNRLLPKLLRK